MTGSVIEIVDPAKDANILLPERVLINGTDVGFLTEDGIEIVVGGKGEPTMVKLTLLPSRVVFRSEASA